MSLARLSQATAPSDAALDWIGAAASLGCALHCLFVPVLLSLAPVVGAALHSHTFDRYFVALALAFGGLVLARGWRRHRDLRPLGWYAGSALLLIGGVTVLHELPGHTLILGLGGIALALAHWCNRRAWCATASLAVRR